MPAMLVAQEKINLSRFSGFSAGFPVAVFLVAETRRFFEDTETYKTMSMVHNPCYDGKAAERLAQLHGSLRIGRSDTKWN